MHQEECVSDRSSTYHTGNGERTTSNDVLLQPDTLPQHTQTHTRKNQMSTNMHFHCVVDVRTQTGQWILFLFVHNIILWKVVRVFLITIVWTEHLSNDRLVSWFFSSGSGLGWFWWRVGYGLGQFCFLKRPLSSHQVHRHSYSYDKNWKRIKHNMRN